MSSVVHSSLAPVPDARLSPVEFESCPQEATRRQGHAYALTLSPLAMSPDEADVVIAIHVVACPQTAPTDAAADLTQFLRSPFRDRPEFPDSFES
jgi:hypothetical protein